MLLLRWLWIGNGQDGEIPPIAVFWTLRVLMFLISFVLEDWALHELIQSPRHRRVAVLLVASSYVTWTYQTHTFSNSIETLVVAWSLVLIQRLADPRVRLSFSHVAAKWTNQLTRYQRAATVMRPIRHCSWNSRRIWRLQPNYLSSLSFYSRVSPDSRFLEEVRHPTCAWRGRVRANMLTYSQAWISCVLDFGCSRDDSDCYRVGYCILSA